MKKIMTISDNPLSASGVARQTRLAIESFLDSGAYDVVSIAVSQKPESLHPYITEKYGDKWKLFPSDSYSDLEVVRSLVKSEKPDLIWIMTDPRFFEGFWRIETEVRSSVPVLYYHVWDNYPYPYYNEKYYQSNDAIVTISELTKDVVSTVCPSVKTYHLPHTVDTSVFKPVSETASKGFLEANKIPHEGKTIFFWNNRNAIRKHCTSLLWWFKLLLDDIGHEKALLIIHTDPKEKTGPDLITNLEHLNLTNGQVFLSNKKVSDAMLNTFYNLSDCTINIADAEGFGLSSLESMAAGTPVISTLTGGLKDQIFDGENWYGVGIEPSSKMIVGSQTVPYIFEDRINSADFIGACKKIINMPKKDLKEWGKNCRKNVLKRFYIGNYKKEWIRIASEVIEQNGSWDDRINYSSWGFAKV